MPLPSNPDFPEFYVYQFSVGKLPFYIGIGRDKRASDRIRYVKSVINRRVKGLYVKPKSNSVLLMEELINRNIEIDLTYLFSNVTRGDALIKENETITRLIETGYRLVNEKGNPNKETNITDLVNYLIKQ